MSKVSFADKETVRRGGGGGVTVGGDVIPMLVTVSLNGSFEDNNWIILDWLLIAPLGPFQSSGRDKPAAKSLTRPPAPPLISQRAWRRMKYFQFYQLMNVLGIKSSMG